MTAEYTRPLDRLSRADEPQFGGKSANLGELLAADIPVPPGFALSTAAFHAFVHAAGLEDRISTALAGLVTGDVDAINHASHAISEAMRFAPVPDEVRDEITAGYAQLGEGSPPVAVRSSAVGEDSQDATFAGQQETYLWVRGAEHVCDAVRDCWVSLYSPPAISYRLRLGDAAHAPAMGVTVQLMVDAAVSGVMFTCNPVSGDPSMVAINATGAVRCASRSKPRNVTRASSNGPTSSGWSISRGRSSATSAAIRTSSGRSRAERRAACSSFRRALSRRCPRSPRSRRPSPRCR
jgi:pyruvate,water dikinase